MNPLNISAARFIEFLSNPNLQSTVPNIISSGYHLEFENVNVTEKIILDNIKIERRVFINGGKYDLEFKDLTITEWFRIVNGNFSNFKIYKIETSGNGIFSISGGTFQNVLEIHGGNYHNNFTIDGGEFINGMRVTGGFFKKYFQIIGGNFKRWVEFSNCHVVDWFYLHRSSFEYGIQIHSGKYGHLNIWQCENLKDIFMSNRFGTAVELGQLSISSNSPLKVFCEEVIMNEIDFKRKIINKDIQLLFSNCQIRNILFDQFVNFGYISFTNLSPNFQIQDKGKILIKNSNLGKIDFVNCNLNSYEIDFLNSRISEISIIGGNFDKKINSLINSNEINTQEKLFYGQLKKSFENLGNLPLSIEANANFMEAHLNSIKNEKSKYSYKTAVEYFNIWLNKISNQHGKSTSVALTSLILVSIYLFFIFCISLVIKKKFMEFTFNNSILFASAYLEFINPLHKLDSILDIFKISKPNGLSKFIDASSKLIISYFIYQFIQAFRKYRN